MLMYLPDHAHPWKRGILLRIYNQFTQGLKPVVKCFFFKRHWTYCYNKTEAYNSQAASSQCGQQLGNCEQNLDPQDTEHSSQQFNNSEQSPQDTEEDSIISLSESLCSGVTSEESSVYVDKMDDDDSDSVDDTSIEVCKAPVPVHDLTRLPEKLEQLIAELHFLLVAKLIRSLAKRNAS